VAPLLGWRQFLLILLVVLVGGARSIRGVIVTGLITGVALAAMSLQLGQVLYAQLILIVAFVAILKVRGNQLADTVKV
jgi:branched-chain amino acid transport system permease protein/urea transport system permease protein